MYTVYVLYSEEHDKIYIGYTSNLEQRLKSHNELGTKGWRYDIGYGELFIQNRSKQRVKH